MHINKTTTIVTLIPMKMLLLVSEVSLLLLVCSSWRWSNTSGRCCLMYVISTRSDAVYGVWCIVHETWVLLQLCRIWPGSWRWYGASAAKNWGTGIQQNSKRRHAVLNLDDSFSEYFTWTSLEYGTVVVSVSSFRSTWLWKGRNGKSRWIFNHTRQQT